MVDKKVIEKLKNWCEKTTAHGIPNVVSAERTSIKILWILCILGSTAYCSFVLSTNITDFLKFNVETVVEITRDSNADFPTITFCNLHLCEKDFKLNENISKILYEELSKNENLTQEKFDIKTRNINSYTISKAIREYYIKMYGQNISNKMINQTSSIKNSIISCQYSSDFCNEKDFEVFRLNEFQTCYKFNSGLENNGNRTQIRKARRYGKNYGFQLELFLGFKEDCSTPLINTYGTIVYVHNNTYNINEESYGILLAPGTETNIAIDRLFVIRKPDPYTQCNINNLKSNFPNSLVENTIKLTNSYTQQSCLQLCYQEFLVNEYKCYNEFMIYYSNPTVTKCSMKPELLNDSNYTNRELFFANGKDKECLEQCQPECEYVTYETTVSTSQFPTITYTEVLVYNENVSDNFKDLKGANQFQKVKSSVLSVNVFYKNDLVTQISQKPSITTDVFVSNIGGTLGVFLGMSLLSFVEIFEFIFQVFLIYYEKFSNKTTIKQEPFDSKN